MLLKAKLENLTRGTRGWLVNDGKQACGDRVPPCMVPKPNHGTPQRHLEPTGARLSLTHTPTPAREKSLNFFAFEQQQMGNWPINCCDDLGLPFSARNF